MQSAPSIHIGRTAMAGIASIARGGSVGYPVRVLIARKGDMTFENLLRRLRCKRCRAVKPAPVYLVAGHHRTRRGGPDADWSIALAPRVPSLHAVQAANSIAPGRCLARNIQRGGMCSTASAGPGQ